MLIHKYQPQRSPAATLQEARSLAAGLTGLLDIEIDKNVEIAMKLSARLHCPYVVQYVILHVPSAIHKWGKTRIIFKWLPR
jgi:hypothetical protein